MKPRSPICSGGRHRCLRWGLGAGHARTNAMTLQLPRGPLAIGHRGGAGLPANEGSANSLRAVAHADERGYQYIETDVQASGDGVAFVLHDADLARVAGRDVAVGDLTAADVRALTLSGGESIPPLAELLEA